MSFKESYFIVQISINLRLTNPIPEARRMLLSLFNIIKSTQTPANQNMMGINSKTYLDLILRI